jgi:hypothetical protein
MISTESKDNIGFIIFIIIFLAFWYAITLGFKSIAAETESPHKDKIGNLLPDLDKTSPNWKDAPTTGWHSKYNIFSEMGMHHDNDYNKSRGGTLVLDYIGGAIFGLMATTIVSLFIPVVSNSMRR